MRPPAMVMLSLEIVHEAEGDRSTISTTTSVTGSENPVDLQAARRYKDILKATSSSSNANKRKNICLGVEAQRSLPNPDHKGRQGTASSKTSSTKSVADKLAKKPSDDKWETDMKKVEIPTILITTTN